MLTVDRRTNEIPNKPVNIEQKAGKTMHARECNTFSHDLQRQIRIG
jgi:hypothetical protein